MKKLFLLMGMAAAMFSFAGCQKNEIEAPNTNVDGSTFELVAEIVQTKTTLDPSTYAVDWVAGDVIYMVTSDGTWGAPYADDEDATTIAEFTYADGKFATTSTIADGTYTFKAMYAKADQKTWHRGAGSSHSLSATQSQDCTNPTAHIKENDALVGTFTATIPMTEAAQVTMSHIYTMMQVDVTNNTGAEIEVTKFEMTAAGADIAGVFNVESFEEPSISKKQNASSTITVNVTNGTVAAGESLKVYFVMAPLSNYSGDVTFKVTDAEGKTYTKTVTLNGISFEAGKYNTTPYAISTPDKVEAKELPFEESFDSSLGEFTKEEQLPEGLTYVWSHDATHKYAKASAYVSGTRYEQTSYLVSPVLDLTNVENAKVQFDHTGNYFSGTETTSANLCIREVGGDWETIEIPTYWSQNWAWVNSGDIDISKFAGKLIQIGFRYSSTEEIAGTWEVKNVSVTAQAAATELIVSPDEMTVEATGGVASVTYSIVNPKAGKSISATADVDWIESFDYSTSGQIKFNVAANETTDVRTGVVTISYEGAVSVPVAIAQKGKVAADTEEVTIDLTDPGYDNGAEVTSVSKDQVTVTFNKGTNSNSPKFYTTGSAVRVYGGSLFTVSISSGSIVGIELTYGTGDGTNAITTDLGNFETSIWSGSAQSVTFTVGGTTGHRRIQKIKVLYKNDGSIPEPAVLTSIAVENPKTEYTVGDSFVEPTVKATYDDASTATVTGATFDGYDMTTAGEQTVTVSYTEGEVTATTSYNITVSAPVVDDSDYSGQYAIVAYRNSESLYYYLTNEETSTSTVRLTAVSAGTNKPEDNVVVNASKLWNVSKSGSVYTIQSVASEEYVSWTSGNSAVMSETGLQFTVTKQDDGSFNFVSGDRYLSLNSTKGSNYFAMYAGTQTHNLYLIKAVEGEEAPATLESIAVSGEKTTYTVGDEFVKPTVTATYSDGSTEDVTASAEFIGYNMSVADTYTVTVSYSGKTTTYSITVSAAQGGGDEGGETTGGYTLITSLSDITTGQYVIAAKVNGTYYAMSNEFAAKINGTSVTVTDNAISESDAVNYVVTITKNGTGFSISSGTKYLKYNSSTNLGTQNTAYNWTISEGVNGTFRATSGTSGRGILYRTGNYNQFGGYSLSNATSTSDEYFDIELFKLN